MSTTTNVNDKIPQPLRLLATVKDAIMGEGFIGGPSPLKLAHLVNLFKAGTLPFCLYLMRKYDNYNETMVLYAGLHGSYGLVWLLKEYFAPDRGWQHRVTIPTIVCGAIFPLGAYWLAPYLIAKKTAPKERGGDPSKQPSRLRRLTATITYVVGVALMFGSDIQKHFVLKERPGLITDGFFGVCRNMNYFGECLIYGSFAALVPRECLWQSFGVLAGAWSVLFATQIAQKEVRMSRHAGWAEYAKKVACIIPFLI